MTNTKRALVLSVFALVLCVSMLVGSTYAWFTDTATTGVSTIQAGTLEVDLVDANDATLVGQSLTFQKAAGAENEPILWEPGCKYELEEVYVKNAGNLALKYQIIVNGLDGDAELLKVIDFKVMMNNAEVDLDTFEGKLAADEKSAAITLVGEMSKDAGNEYQGKTLSGLSITVVATQDTVESDSYGNQYDANAQYPEVVVVTNATDFVDAINDGKAVTLTEDIDLSKIDLTTVTNDVVIDAAGHKITTSESYGIEALPGKNITVSNAEVEMTKDGTSTAYAAGFKISNGDYAGVTITLENCNISMANADWAYAVTMPSSVKNLNLVIDNCVLEGAIAVQCWGDNNTITITNSELICNYTTSAMYTSSCVALQNDGTNVSENNTVVIDNCEFSYSGVDNYNSSVYSYLNYGTNNTVTITNSTYDAKIVDPD